MQLGNLINIAVRIRAGSLRDGSTVPHIFHIFRYACIGTRSKRVCGETKQTLTILSYGIVKVRFQDFL